MPSQPMYCRSHHDKVDLSEKALSTEPVYLVKLSLDVHFLLIAGGNADRAYW
jgi:hypothetical protein